MLDITKEFEVGEWTVIPSENLLQKQAVQIQIESRIINVLLCLAEHDGQAVTIETLLQSVWKDQVVSTSAIYRAIAELRKALESDSDSIYIKTISKKGYCLTQPVSQKNSKISTRTFITTGTLLALFVAWLVFLVTKTTFEPNETPQIQLPPQSVDYSSYRFQPATSLPGREFSPNLSPDGNYLLFTYQQKDSPYNSIYLRINFPPENTNTIDNRIHGKDRQKAFPLLENGKDHFLMPSWSPDGKAIAYFHLVDGQCQIKYANFDQNKLSLATSRTVAICSVLGINSLDFSKDGRNLVYTSMLSGRLNIHLAKIPSAESKILAEPKDTNSWNYLVAASPFDDQLMILEFKDYRRTLFYLYNLDTETKKLVFENEAYISDLEWGDTPNSVYFRDSANIIKRLNIETGQLSSILNTPNLLGQMTKASQKEIVAFEQFIESTKSIKQVSISGAPLEAYSQLNSTYGEYNPEYANLSSRLAFVSVRTGNNELWISGEGQLPYQLTSFNNEVWTGKLRWSKDDRNILFARGGNIYIYDFDTESIILVEKAMTGQTLFSPSWSSNNKAIFYSQFEKDQVSLIKKNLDQFGDKETVGSNIRNFQPDFNGEAAYFSLLSRHGIFKFDSKTDSSHLLIPEVHAESWNSWRVAKDGIYYLDAFAKPASIKFYDFKTKEKSVVTQWPGRLKGAFSLSPSKTTIAHDNSDNLSSDIMLFVPPTP